MAMTSDAPTPLVARLAALAATEPEWIAVTAVDGDISRGDLEVSSDAWACELISLGVQRGDYVAIVMPNGVEFVSVLVAVWKTGAVPAPLSVKLSHTELFDMLELLNPRVVVGVGPERAGNRVCLPCGHRPAFHPEANLDRTVISPSWKAIGSGGSTGRPKVIVTPAPATLEVQLAGMGVLGIREGDVSVITAPLSHNGPFISLVHTLLLGGRVVLTDRFDAETLLQTVQQEGATWLYLVPTMMSRIWKLPHAIRGRYNLDTLRTVVHMGAPCPAWLKQAWVDWLGPDRLRELYTSTEAIVVFAATGREWIEHPGTVGLPIGGQAQIRSAAGDVLPPGETGLIWLLRDPELGQSYQYLGATATGDGQGWQTLGDIGRVDVDGYLYVEDRESDMILVGGSNVYAAEVEAAVLDHPAVADACVIGLPNEDLGQVPHALVYATAEVSEAELSAHILERVAPYKRPRSYEFVNAPLRDAAGKIRRQQLRAERLSVTQSTT
jgi:bile acid-coenzyme A ligase